MKPNTILKHKYRIEGPLASGGMGKVYAGKVVGVEGFEKDVAIKVLKRDDDEWVARFMREANLWSQLSHPHIVQVFDFDRMPDDGPLFLVMERLFGRDLTALTLPLPEEVILPILDAVLQALEAAHAQGIIHRDVALDNIIVTDDGQIKLTDFGLARYAKTSEVTQTDGKLIGKVPYMSPEQVEGRPLDARTDLFSLGVVLYRLLTKRSPWGEGSQTKVMHRIVSMAPFVMPPGISAGLHALCDRLLAKQPDDRFASAAEALEAVRALGHIPTTVAVGAYAAAHPKKSPVVPTRAHIHSSTATRSDRPPASKRGRRKSARSLAAWAGLLTLGMGVGLALGRSDRQGDTARGPGSAAALDVRNGAGPPAMTRTSTVGMHDRTYAATGPIIGLDCAGRDGRFPACVHDCAYVPAGLPQVDDPDRTHGLAKRENEGLPARPDIDAETASARRMHNRAYASAGKPTAKTSQTPPVHDRTYAGAGKPERPGAFEVRRPLPKERPPPAVDPPLYVGVRVFGDPDGQATATLHAAVKPWVARIRRCFLRRHPAPRPKYVQVGFMKSPGTPIQELIPDGVPTTPQFATCLLKQVPALKTVPTEGVRVSEIFVATDKRAFDEDVLVF